MGVLSGVGDARQGYKKLPYLGPGDFLLVVRKLEGWETRKNKRMFKAEVGILESNSAEHPVGSERVWMANLTDHEGAPGDVNACLAAIMGGGPDDLDDPSAERAIGEEQPCVGRLVKCSAHNTITKERQKDFTVTAWYPVPQELQVQSAALCAAVGL